MTVPVDVGRDEAREAAQRELTDPAYQAAQPGLLDRAFRWLGERVTELFDLLTGALPGGPAGLVVLVLLVVALVVVIRLRVGRLARTARARSDAVFTEAPRGSGHYRQAAEQAYAEGRLDVAVRERFRAVVRGLEERGVLAERSGHTADEAAIAAGARLPDVAGDLRAAAALFDDVHYGGYAAKEDGYRALVALDERVRASRPVMAG